MNGEGFENAEEDYYETWVGRLWRAMRNVECNTVEREISRVQVFAEWPESPQKKFFEVVISMPRNHTHQKLCM